MRISIIVLLALTTAELACASALPPLGVKDVSLMLRSGYSSDAVQGEVSKRRFIDPIDAAAEKSLLQAGAAPAFVELLKSGAFAIPPEQLAAAQEEMAAKAKRRQLQAEEARKFNTLYQNQQAQAKAAPTSPTMDNAVAALVKGDLVTSKNGVLNTFNDQPLERKKLIALYFSAHWCGPCRKFTPQLVEYYNRMAAAHPEFELVFVSSDRSAPAMEAYMRDTQMPWPAVKFDKIAPNLPLRQYAGPGIPCLVLLGADGKVISNTYDGKTYLGPEKVLADIDKILVAGTTGPVAQQR